MDPLFLYVVEIYVYLELKVETQACFEILNTCKNVSNIMTTHSDIIALYGAFSMWKPTRFSTLIICYATRTALTVSAHKQIIHLCGS